MPEKFVAKLDEFKDGERRIVFIGDNGEAFAGLNYASAVLLLTLGTYPRFAAPLAAGGGICGSALSAT